jgi:hypothetical protein
MSLMERQRHTSFVLRTVVPQSSVITWREANQPQYPILGRVPLAGAVCREYILHILVLLVLERCRAQKHTAVLHTSLVRDTKRCIEARWLAQAIGCFALSLRSHASIFLPLVQFVEGFAMWLVTRAIFVQTAVQHKFRAWSKVRITLRHDQSYVCV